MAGRVVPVIHSRGHRARLDVITDLVTFVARTRTLATLLDELPRRIAQIFSADVCSIYVLEHDDLVMRGNLGFERSAIGEVRLAMGEGLSGLCAECLRPVTVVQAPDDARYKHFPQLREDRYPVFMAVPVMGARGIVGVLVVQRRAGRAFDSHDVELAVALTIPLASAIERAHLPQRDERSNALAAHGRRRLTLPARSVVPGRAVGALRSVRRPSLEARASRDASPSELEQRVLSTLRSFARAVEQIDPPSPSRRAAPSRAILPSVSVLLGDERLRERFAELVEEKGVPARALAAIASEASRAAERTGDEFSKRRAAWISDVCDAIAVEIFEYKSREFQRGAVLLAEQFGLFEFLVTRHTPPVAVVLSRPLDDALERELLIARGVPTLAECESALRWAADGDVALVDADHGLLRLDPSRAEIAKVRAMRSAATRS